MKMFKQIGVFQKVFLFSLLLVMFSCTTPLQEITYLNTIETGKTYTDGPSPGIYQVRPSDHLYIHVIGDDPTAVAFLNLMPTTTGSFSSQSLELVTFIVDEEGNINYPQFGEIHVAGKTIDQIREELQKRVNTYMQNSSAFVKLINRTITVLGEVRTPGQHPMVKNKLSIFEALGTAGDINDYGNRRNIKLIREIQGGKLVESIDLTNPNLISSPYYYVLPHDILYVEASSKVYGRKTMPFGTGVSLVFSAISTALLLINYLK
jgi:polysaccharide export outer membrane protein